MLLALFVLSAIARSGSAVGSFAIAGWLGVLMAVLGVAGALGFVIAYLDRSRVKNTLDLYREETEVQQKRIATLEDENSHLQGQVSELQGAIRVLTNTVTQSAKLDMFASTSEAQHRALLMKLETIGAQLTSITRTS